MQPPDWHPGYEYWVARMAIRDRAKRPIKQRAGELALPGPWRGAPWGQERSDWGAQSSPICQRKNDQTSAVSLTHCERPDPMPCPPSKSTRSSTGLPLAVAA